MTEVISTLIDKQDNFEVVRDQLALILKTEVTNQVALATTAGKPDPNDWNLRIFTERFNPWEEFLQAQGATADLTSIVNIWYDNGNFPRNKGDAIKRQTSEAIYNFDCYSIGISEDNPTGGHIPGDKDASFEVQKAIRFVRNILMAAINMQLQLQGTVGERWIQSIDVFQPQLDGSALQRLIGARIALKVTFNEVSPQVIAETLEQVSVDIKRLENGEIVLEADYVY